MTSIGGPHYIDSVFGSLLGTALGDAVGYPLELLSSEQVDSIYDPMNGAALAEDVLSESGQVSDDTQLTLYILDGLCEALEWNNQGTPADELACLWLALLRWYRSIGGVLDPAAPPVIDRAIDTFEVLRHRRGPGKATLAALGSGQMQTLTRNINPQALGSGALVRSAALGFLPLEEQDTLVSLAARAAALTHGHPQAIVSACAYALLVHHTIGYRGIASAPCLQAAQDTVNWLYTLPHRQLPAAGETLTALEHALENSEKQLSPQQADQLFGNCWLAPSVLGRGVQVALTAEDHKIEALAALGQAAHSAGDSDSIAAITGSLLGAAQGSAIFPTESLEKIDVLPAIETLLNQWKRQVIIAG